VQVTRTIRCKLIIPEADLPVLSELFTRYANACSEIAQWGRDNRESNAFRLHYSLYRKIKTDYRLTANLVVTALRRVAGDLKTAKLKGKFQYRPTFVCLDRDTFRLILKKNEISYSTHAGRKRAKLDIGDYQREALASASKCQSATLVRTRDGRFFANIAIVSEVPDAAPGGVLGVDLGIRNIAVTSFGLKFNGKPIRRYREERWRIRASLQSKGTRNAKRVLKRLSGREARRVANENHVIAKRIVENALENGCSMIRMEKLKGIRDRLRVPNKHLNRMMSLWSFYQLQKFIRYKAAMRGIAFERINPAYTSRTCGSCGKPGVRDRETFTCTTCGEFDADCNAARVIAAGGVRVNAPRSDGSDQKSL
jgi:IS605 OrfB family transposase